MPSEALEALCRTLAEQPRIGTADIAATRAAMDAMVGSFPLTADTSVAAVDAGGRAADWVTVPDSDVDRVVLYLHGGGYALGSPRTHRELASRIARTGRARVLVIDYRLAPEHPFPAAVEDATAAYRWLRGQGVAAAAIAVAGDSAGGGLTLATLFKLRQDGDELPACAVCLSPWTDLEGTGASAQPGGADDPMVEVAALRDMAKIYAGDALTDPLAAPLHGDFRNLPPLLLQVGTREVLLDDATRVAAAARAAGVDVTLEIEDGAPHVYQVYPDLPESVAALARIGAFLRRHIVSSR